jgi:F-type H+-transporting ATPase subunit alpha
MRAVAGRLRVDLAQYRELEAFAAFGSDLDKASQQQLARGARLVELLKQPASSPFPIGREIVSIWAGTSGKLDHVAVGDVRRFESELLDYIQHTTADLFEKLATANKFDDDLANELEKVVDDFSKLFQPTPDKSSQASGKPSESSENSSKSDDSAKSSNESDSSSDNSSK